MWQGACGAVRDMCGRGVCVVGGMCGKGGHVWQGGMPCTHLRTPQDMVGQCVGGTHPTGMHSCFFLLLLKIETHIKILRLQKDY